MLEPSRVIGFASVYPMRFGFRRPGLLLWSVYGVLGTLLLLAGAAYFFEVPAHPPGFAIDESSICYNAYTISQKGCDEYGQSWPLFFRAFGEYKNPTIIYILAALFRLTGPSIFLARLLCAVSGMVSALLIGLLAWRMTRRWVTTAVVTIGALLTPWLFECSRLVFEVAIYPALVVLFLLVAWRASSRSRWNWSDVFGLGVTLALLTYSSSIGRLFAPLIALGLGVFVNRSRWRAVLAAWGSYGLLLVPLLIFHRLHPDALTGRFKALTYFSPDDSLGTSLSQFGRHYLANVDPLRWLITGESDIRDHLQGMGSLLAASVCLAILGLIIVLRHHRHEAWWRFLIFSLIVAPVPASLTSNPFPQLRLVAFPVIFLLFMIPALSWLNESNGESRAAKIGKPLLLSAAVTGLLAQGFLFQWRYHQVAPKLWYVFDARFARKILAPALAAGRRPIALVDEPGKAGYIQALWHGVLAHCDAGHFVRLPSGERPPSGAVVISTEQECHDCRLIARSLNYIVYLVPPYPESVVAERQPLSAFQGSILCENPPAALVGGQKIVLRFLVKNISAVEWPAVEDNAVTLQNRWRNNDDTLVADHDDEESIPYDAEPGDTLGLVLRATVPPEPGNYLLEVDLVQKQSGWFSEQGSTSWKQRVKVVAQE